MDGDFFFPFSDGITYGFILKSFSFFNNVLFNNLLTQNDSVKKPLFKLQEARFIYCLYVRGRVRLVKPFHC